MVQSIQLQHGVVLIGERVVAQLATIVKSQNHQALYQVLSLLFHQVQDHLVH